MGVKTKVSIQDGEFDAKAAKYLNYGIDHVRVRGEGEAGTAAAEGQGEGEGRQLFFKALPKVSFDVGVERGGVDHFDFQEMMVKDLPSDVRKQRVLLRVGNEEAEKARQFAQLVDLRNANARGIAFENRRRIIEAFSPSGSPADSGYPEVQGEDKDLPARKDTMY